MANGFKISTQDVNLIAKHEGGNLMTSLRLNPGQQYEEVLLRTGAKIKVKRHWDDGRKRIYHLVSYTPDLRDISVYLELVGQTDLLDIINN